ncbi:hypothetical protein HDU97_001265 [Phlyctochytrium planicorne]|nr:hypothetical protein HDU97_001265 [Phlyctochytrium planicorne]
MCGTKFGKDSSVPKACASIRISSLLASMGIVGQLVALGILVWEIRNMNKEDGGPSAVSRGVAVSFSAIASALYLATLIMVALVHWDLTAARYENVKMIENVWEWVASLLLSVALSITLFVY